jgi:hypothetical protein
MQIVDLTSFAEGRSRQDITRFAHSSRIKKGEYWNLRGSIHAKPEAGEVS